MDKRKQRQFEAAERAVVKAAAKIERVIEDLFEKTFTLEDASYHYVIERWPWS
jgi:hypothetical protein